MKQDYAGGRFTFTQEADCCDTPDTFQELHIEVHDGGDGQYYRVVTEGWAVDKLEDMLRMLERVTMALGSLKED